MDNSDVSFQCIDADEASEDNVDEDFDLVNVRVTANGKHVRGRDIDWKEKVT